MSLFGSVGKFLGNAAKTAGRVAGAPVKVASKATGAIGKQISKVPVVGKGIHGVFDLTVGAPIAFAGAVASGARIDRAAMSSLKQGLDAARDVGPYAQAIVSLVPGVGTGVAGALAAGLALSEGKSLTEAVKAGVIASLPGGALGKVGFNVGAAALQGKPLDGLVKSLPLPSDAAAQLTSGLSQLKKIASGAKVSPAEAAKVSANVQSALAKLPPDVRKSVQVGIAFEHGRLLQAAGKKGITSQQARGMLAMAGAAVKSEAAEAIRKTLTDPMGFNVGLGVMRNSGVTPLQLKELRNSLAEGDERKGFDLALAAHIGTVTAKAPPRMTPKVRAAYYTTVGMRTAGMAQKTGMLKTLADADPQLKAGITAGVKHVEDEKLGFFGRILRALGIK